jgi:hypothetical protein
VARLRTPLLLTLFALFATFSLTAAPVAPHQQARRWMAEAQQTSNPIRLFMLALDIKEALNKALKQNPNDVEVRLDLLRFHSVTPKVAGGDPAEARAQAAALTKLDEGLGHFANGYLAYRDKQFGVARRELNEAVRLTTGAHRNLALQWLGWLSQESQQYADAFAVWEQLRPTDPKANFEIARTAVFCNCERAKGKAALEAYLKVKPRDAEARKLVGRLK